MQGRLSKENLHSTADLCRKAVPPGDERIGNDLSTVLHGNTGPDPGAQNIQDITAPYGAPTLASSVGKGESPATATEVTSCVRGNGSELPAPAPISHVVAETLGRAVSCAGGNAAHFKPAVPNNDVAVMAPNRTLSAQEQLSRLRQKFKPAQPPRAIEVDEAKEPWKASVARPQPAGGTAADNSASKCAGVYSANVLPVQVSGTAQAISAPAANSSEIMSVAKKPNSQMTEPAGAIHRAAGSTSRGSPLLTTVRAEADQNSVRERAAAQLPAAKKVKTDTQHNSLGTNENAEQVVNLSTKVSYFAPAKSNEEVPSDNQDKVEVQDLALAQNSTDAQEFCLDQKPKPVAVQDKLQQAKERRARIEQEKEDARKLSQRARAQREIDNAVKRPHGELAKRDDGHKVRQDNARAAADTKSMPLPRTNELRALPTPGKNSKRCDTSHYMYT